MKSSFNWILILLLTAAACTTGNNKTTETEIEEIKSVLALQVEAWNRGDIDTYMQGYWQSDSLIFTGGKNLTKGWKQAKERYEKSYPNQAAMGTLNFSELEVRLTSEKSAFATGRWLLSFDTNSVDGRFTLVWQKKKNQWVIMADHSS